MAFQITSNIYCQINCPSSNLLQKTGQTDKQTETHLQVVTYNLLQRRTPPRRLGVHCAQCNKRC